MLVFRSFTILVGLSYLNELRKGKLLVFREQKFVILIVFNEDTQRMSCTKQNSDVTHAMNILIVFQWQKSYFVTWII